MLCILAGVVNFLRVFFWGKSLPKEKLPNGVVSCVIMCGWMNLIYLIAINSMRKNII